jgi:hypothetical protein
VQAEYDVYAIALRWLAILGGNDEIEAERMKVGKIVNRTCDSGRLPLHASLHNSPLSIELCSPRVSSTLYAAILRREIDS